MAVSDRPRLLATPLYSIKFIQMLKLNPIDVFYRLKHKNLKVSLSSDRSHNYSFQNLKCHLHPGLK